MEPARFRAATDRMDRLLADRLGDRAVRPDGVEVGGMFLNPFLGATLAPSAARLSKVTNTDEVVEPSFTGRVEDLQGLKAGDILTINLPPARGGGPYKVLRLRPDGTGWVAVSLGASHARTDDIT